AASDAAGTPAPTLQGTLVLAGSELEPYVAYLGASRLGLSGPVDFTDPQAPVFHLDAVAGAASRDIAAPRIAEVGLRLVNDYPDVFTLGDVKPLTSAVLLYARVEFGQGETMGGTLTAPLLQGDYIWPLSFSFGGGGPTLAGGVLGLMSFFGVSTPSAFALPPGVAALGSFALSQLELGIRPPLDGRSFGLESSAVTLRSQTSWDPPIPFVRVEEVGTRWRFGWRSLPPLVTGSVWGTLSFGARAGRPTPPDAPRLWVNLDLSSWELAARTLGDITLPLPGAFRAYYDGDTPAVDPSLVVKAIGIRASLVSQTYTAELLTEGNWPLAIGQVRFNLDSVVFQMAVTQGAVSGELWGYLSIRIDDQRNAVFMVSAAYPGTGAWEFAGGLVVGPLKLVDFVLALLGRAPGPELPEVNLVELWVQYSTAAGNPYSARGALEVRWTPTLLGRTLSLVARASIARRRKTDADRALALALPGAADGEMVYEGALSGTFSVNRLSVTAGLSFVGSETVYLFEVAFGTAAVRAATQWVDDRAGGGRHQVLTISLRGLTLGQVVEYLVNLANPNLNYQLDAPWSVLNAIDLSRFRLAIDPTEQTLALTYDVKLELGFMSVQTVGILYDRSRGEGSVRFVLTGRFLTRTYDSRKPLSWDAAKDPPPQVPGKGTQLFQLRYLGMGQRVTLSGLTSYDSVGEVLAALREEMQPPSDPNANPLTGSRLRFDESSQWMFGIDCTVMETVSLGLVLHDPDLYGLVVSLAGTRAGSLAGLSFELLYKKVTDTIGVFRVRLQVPDMFRQLQLGYVSVTLGVITVDVFTNGNFRVDLGFPRNNDFSDSFGLEAGPFIGSGGLYFGVLNGATSRRVPAVTNGSFDPVLELGVGLAVGVGRTFRKGPLRAGLYVQMVAIFEGVLAWFAPDDAAAAPAMYYWARGSAGLIGKVYGTVDFKVVRVSVSVEAHAIVTVTLAAYQQAVVELDVGVEVHAEVEILFVSVSFSFRLRLTASFTIGENQAAPWTLAADQGGRGRARLMDNVAAPRRRTAAEVRAATRDAFLLARAGETPRRALVTRTDAPGQDAYDLHWRTDLPVFPDGAVHPVTVKMLPAYTVDGVPVQWPDQPAPAGSTAYRIAFLLMADNGVAPGADGIAATRALTAATSATAATGEGTAFGVMVEGVLRWAVSALGIDPVRGTVTAGQLQHLADQLELPEARADGFSMATLGGFFLKNLELRVSGVPGGSPARTGGTAFPVPPPLGWDSGAPAPDPYRRRFAGQTLVDATWQAEVAAWYAPLEPDPARHADVQSALGAARPDGRAGEGGEGDAAESLATSVFRDYFLMIARTAVQAAIAVMESFPYAVTGAADETLDGICALFPPVALPYLVRAGDTVDQVAHAFGVATSELLALNPGIADALAAAAPGESIDVTIGATPESVAAANPAWPLQAGRPVALGDVVHQAGEGETLAGMAQAFGADVDAWLRTDALLQARPLLRQGASIALPAGASWANENGLPLTLMAAVTYVRRNGTEGVHLADAGGVPLVEWYVQAIGDLNAVQADGPLPATLRVPRAYDQLADPLTWTTLAGDTLWEVAAYFALAQQPAGDAGFTEWLAALRALNPGPDPVAAVVLPATSTAVLAGERLADVAARIAVQLPDPAAPGRWLPRDASFRALVKGADLLVPLTPVTIPGCSAATAAGDTLGSFAARYDLSPEDAGHRLASVGGVLAAWAGETLQVPHPGSAAVGASAASPGPGELVPAVLRTASATIGGQVSRFMLHGMRMPAPVLTGGVYRATGPMTGMYELIGQQLPGPAPAPGNPPETERLRITVRRFDDGATWVRLYDSTALDAGAPVEPLLALNPGLAHRAGAHQGVVALTGEIPELVFRITEADLAYPATALSPVFAAGGAPGPLEPFRDVAVRHGVQQRIAWQTTESIALPNPGGAPVPRTGMPSLWPFTGDLLATAAAFPADELQLCRTDPQLGPGAPPVALSRFAWATRVEVGIRRIPGRAGTYEAFGTDTAGRQVLLDAWRYLTRAGQTDTATVHLLYAPSPAAGLPTGLASVPLDAGRSYLVKTNLSTETHSGDAAFARGRAADPEPPTWGEYFARVADSARFLTLMWECSVVGGGGYWLQYTAADGSPLPETIFAADGTARLTLVVLLASQTAAAPARTLQPFNNCAVVGESVDASAASLFAQVAGGAQTVRHATLAPGNAAFSLALRKPPADAAGDAQEALRRLYGLVGYRLAETPAFTGSHEAMPVGPQVPSSARPQAGDEQTWSLFQVVPVHRFARSYPLPAVAGLPAPEADPYAGISTAAGSDPAMASARVLLTFREVMGNTSAAEGTAAEGGPLPVDLPVGYTDPVIGLGSWPAVTASFRVEPAAAGAKGAVLEATATLQASTHLPGAGQRAAAARATAADHLQRLSQAYYQVMQPDATVSLFTTLEADAGVPVPLDARREALRA
ncbi:MAG TPA: LysM peptidoglycan-binding domain-containing protein, partial [Longimicrobium sp.]|nr:LysM peptidoglycan-binding domain-containing protein [Longimicrobium sp.]